MVSIRKHIKAALLITGILTVFFSANLFLPEICAADQPWGIYVERDEDTDGPERCKYCGRTFWGGGIHRDAEVIVENHLKQNLRDMNIPYLDSKGSDRYINVFIYKFTERRGGNLAVDKPASVGFHIHLIDRNNIVRRVFVYEETQQALSQNVFNIRKVLRRRAKWLTVSELAEEGIYTALQKLQDDLK